MSDQKTPYDVVQARARQAFVLAEKALASDPSRMAQARRAASIRERARRKLSEAVLYRAEANGLLWALNHPATFEYSPDAQTQAAFERGRQDALDILQALEPSSNELLRPREAP